MIINQIPYYFLLSAFIKPSNAENLAGLIAKTYGKSLVNCKVCDNLGHSKCNEIICEAKW